MSGSAVSVLGPKAVLAAIPLNITGEETDLEFQSSWLLPLLRENIRHTELSHFTEYFLPLAARCPHIEGRMHGHNQTPESRSKIACMYVNIYNDPGFTHKLMKIVVVLCIQ